MMQLTEVTELNNLPNGAVLHDGRDSSPYNVWIKDVSMGWGDVVWWQGGCEVPYTATDVPLPALLIHDGTEDWHATQCARDVEVGADALDKAATDGWNEVIKYSEQKQTIPPVGYLYNWLRARVAELRRR